MTVPDGPHYVSPPMRRKPRGWVLPVVTAAVIVALCVGGLTLVAAFSPDTSSDLAGRGRGNAATSSTTARPPVKGPADVPDVEPAGTLTPAQVKVTLKTESKECFGTAGCVLTVRPVFGWPPAAVPAGVEYELTYKITFAGVDSGTDETIGTGRIVGPDDYEADSHVLQTRAKSTKVRVVVDQLEQR